MLGLRNRPNATRKAISNIKVSSPEEVERELKISQKNQRDRYSIQLRIRQTASALRGFWAAKRPLEQSAWTVRIYAKSKT